MVDVSTQLSTVQRAVRTEDRDGATSHVQTLQQSYPVPIEEAWAALTTAERITAWFLPISGELAPGGKYQLEGNAGGTVLECRPPQDGVAGYRITWEFGGGVSWVSVQLAADGDDATRVTLEHVARAAEIPAEMWQTYGPGATGVGWDGGLLGLSLHLGGVEGSLSPSEAAAWAGTDEGKAFYRDAAEAWGDAHAASGADPDQARAAAANTYSFYTGDGA